MKPTFSLLLAASLTATATLALTAGAQTATPSPTPPPAASAGLANDWLRSQSPAFDAWNFGGQFRARVEGKDNIAIPGLLPLAVDFSRQHGEDNGYLLLREKLHLGYTPTDWLGAYVEGRYSSSYWDKRDPDPESDGPDLHQAYVTLGNAKQFPLSLKVGRQELAYGDERLIGAFDWNNIGRVFDAAKLRFEDKDLWVDAFVGRVIIPNNDDFNVANDYDFFSGVYASTRTLIPHQESQLYFLARNTSDESPNAIGENLPPILRGASPRDIYTVGARVKSLPGQLAGWDYDAEIAGQFGSWKASPTSPRLDQRALAAHGAGGYTWTKAFGSPRVGLEYNFSTGDSDSKDGTHETFDNLFPTNHKFYGFMDFFSWQNVHDLRLATSIKPLSSVTVSLDYHGFWLADTHDYFYQANGAPRTSGGYGIHPDAGNFVGTELDLVATWTATKWASLQGGYGHFFVGDYVKDSLSSTGGATDADWVYLQMLVNF